MKAVNWKAAKAGLGPNLVRVVLLVLAVVLLAALIYRQVRRPDTVTVKVPVAAENLPPGASLEAEKIEMADLPAESLPGGVVRDRAAIEGRKLAKAKEAGAPFLRGDFSPPDAGPGLAGVLPEGRILMFVPLVGLPMTEITEQLRFGDRFDLIAIGGRQAAVEGRAFASRARAVARDAYYLGWVEPRPPGGAQETETESSETNLGSLLSSALEAQAPSGGGGGTGLSSLLLGIHPEDVIPLAEAQASGAPMALVLHGREEVESGNLLVLPRPRFNEVEIIVGAQRTRIPLGQLRSQ